jgi:hypothetical protein
MPSPEDGPITLWFQRKNFASLLHDGVICEGGMTKIFTAHRVKDYASWKDKYDADADRRQAAGFHEGEHFHSPSDHNSFLIVWDSDLPLVDAKASVSAMYSNPDLLALMQEAGVYLEDIRFWVSED